MTNILQITPLEKDSENFINIIPASEFVPNWYRTSALTLPNKFTELEIKSPSDTTSTYKKCTPFFDALTIGYMAVLTADVEIIRKPDGMPFIMWRTNRTIVTEHTKDQWNGLPVPDGYSPFVYKWHNQIGLKTPKGYSLMFTDPINRFDTPFKTITGIVDTDSFEMAIHFPFFIKNNFSGIIEKGTPIAQIIPIKQDKWKRQTNLYNERTEFVLIDKYRSNIKRAYKNLHWIRKEYK